VGGGGGAFFTQSISVVRVAALAYSTVQIFRMVKDPMISFFPMNLSTENSKSVFIGVMSMQPLLISRSLKRATSTVGRGCWMSSPSSASRLPLISSRKACWCIPVRVSCSFFFLSLSFFQSLFFALSLSLTHTHTHIGGKRQVSNRQTPRCLPLNLSVSISLSRAFSLSHTHTHR